MSKKSAKIAELIDGCRGRDLDAHYLGFFECFNRGLFYESHDVLEELWLPSRHSADGDFYRGLIQLAGAFVHLQKNRLRPAGALFRRAAENLQKYLPVHEHLDVVPVLGLIGQWLGELESGQFTVNPLVAGRAPQLSLLPRTTLLIATRNEHKVGEIRAILGGQFRYLTLRDFPNVPVVIEDAPTFAGNATKKAVELAEWLAAQPGFHQHSSASFFVLADDSGLEVDALNGAPGVYSARFAALDTGVAGNSADADNNAKLLKLVQAVPAARRSARFRCVLALVPLPETTMENASPVCAANEAELSAELFEGVCEGQIGFAPSGANGFGYDPLFIPAGFQKTFAELGEDVKNQLSHRAQALAKLRERWRKIPGRQKSE